MKFRIDEIKKKYPDWVYIKVLANEVDAVNALGRDRNKNGKSLGWHSMTATTGDEWHELS